MITDFPEYERNWEDMHEWIEYHRMLGVEHFYLYPNDCSAEFLKQLRLYEAEGVITLVPLVHHILKSPHFADLHNKCLCHFLRTFGHETYWCAIVDNDEFLVPLQQTDMQSFLKNLDHPNLSQVVIYWKVFGTSYIPKLLSGQLLTEHLIRCQAHSPGFKTVIKPNKTKKITIHHSVPSSGLKRVLPRSVIQINHYTLKDGQFFDRIKWPRWQHFSQFQGRPYQEVLDEYNEKEDLAIQRFIPTLKQRLQFPNHKEVYEN